MRVLVLCLLLASCASPGVVKVERDAPHSLYTGVALSTGGFMSLFHKARLGEWATVGTVRGPLRVRVARLRGDLVYLEDADLRPGDSGAPVYNEDDELIGLIEGRESK